MFNQINVFISIFQILQNFNSSLFYLINHECSNYFFDMFMPIITNLGGFPVIITICCLLFIFGHIKEKQTAILCILAVLGVIFVISTLKPLIGEPRPFMTLSNVNLLVIPSTSNSFPSGHSTLSFAIATVIGLSYKFKFHNKELSLGYLLFAIATIIAFSRIYVGAHYPFDVICGGIVGVTIGLFVLKFKNQVLSNRFINKIVYFKSINGGE